MTATTTVKEDIAIIHRTIAATRQVAYQGRYGGLHKLWALTDDALEALSRLEALLIPHQPSLMPDLTTADTTKSYTHSRPEPDTLSPLRRE